MHWVFFYCQKFPHGVKTVTTLVPINTSIIHHSNLLEKIPFINFFFNIIPISKKSVRSVTKPNINCTILHNYNQHRYKRMQKRQTRRAAATYVASLGILSLMLTSTTFAASPNNATPVLFPLDTFPAQSTTGTTISYQLSAYDPDVVDILTFSMSPVLPGASLDGATGLFTWIPSTTQTGTLTINFSVSDGIDTATLPATITISAPAATQPITFNPIKNQTIIAGETVRFRVSLSSGSNASTKITAANLPRGASFDSKTGYFSWQPGKKDIGTYTIIFTANGTSTASKKVTLTVLSQNTNSGGSKKHSDTFIGNTKQFFSSLATSIQNLIQK